MKKTFCFFQTPNSTQVPAGKSRGSKYAAGGKGRRRRGIFGSSEGGGWLLRGGVRGAGKVDTQLGGSVDRDAGRVRIQLLRLLLHDQAGREDGGRHVHHESGTMMIYNFLFLLLFKN